MTHLLCLEAWKIANIHLRTAQRLWHAAVLQSDPNAPYLHRQLHFRQQAAHLSFKAAMEEMDALARSLRTYESPSRQLKPVGGVQVVAHDSEGIQGGPLLNSKEM